MTFPTRRQRKHFNREVAQLREEFGEFVSFPGSFHRGVSDEQQVEVKLKTSKNNDYTLRCYLGVDYPNSMPRMVVSYPEEPLKDASGVPLGPSYENHCLGYEDYGLTGICHCRADRWNSKTMNLSVVFIKGMLWLEAYEIMKKTGESISTFLPEMPMSEKMKNLHFQMGIIQSIHEAMVQNFVNQMMFALNCQTPEELLAKLVSGFTMNDEEMDG